MFRYHRPFLLTFLAAALMAGDAPPPAVLPAEAQRLIDNAAEAIAKQRQTYLAAAQKEQERLVAALQRQMESETRKGNLASAMAIKAELARISRGEWIAEVELPPQTDLLGQPLPAEAAAGAWISKTATYTTSSVAIGVDLPSLLTAEGPWQGNSWAFHTKAVGNEWVKVDLGAPRVITRIEIVNRSDTCQERVVGALVQLSLDGTQWAEVGKFNQASPTYTFPVKAAMARYLRIFQPLPQNLHLKTIKVFGK